LSLSGGEWPASRHGCFIFREKLAGTRSIVGWFGPSALLYAFEKGEILVMLTKHDLFVFLRVMYRCPDYCYSFTDTTAKILLLF
jgi:hypothetical protein